jgi:hypothetical protein
MMGEKMMSGGESEDQEENAPYRIPLNALLNLIDTLILGIELPKAVETAINRKIEQYYISEEYKFRVAREIRESERKKIEAEGISEFQQIVSKGISDSYLRWRGIEATLQLAQSSNSKIVIMGGGKDGLPIILGNVDASPSPQPASPAGNGDAAPKERTTAATPTTPLEKIPAETLTKPVEKTPPTQPPEAQRLFPTSLSDIKAMLSPLTGTTPPLSDAGKPNSGVSTKPAAEQQH